MDYHIEFITYTEDGQFVKLKTRIVWLPHGGDWPGTYPEMIWQDEQGLIYRQPPLFFGWFRSKEGVVVYQGLQKIALTIPQNDYENHIKVGLDIFHRHTSTYSQEFKHCGLKSCQVCKAAMEIS